MLSFNEFIFEEFSKNDPIPEISRYKTKLGIVLIGLPGAVNLLLLTISYYREINNLNHFQPMMFLIF